MSSDHRCGVSSSLASGAWQAAWTRFFPCRLSWGVHATEANSQGLKRFCLARLIEVVTTLRTSGSEGALELQSFAGQWKTHCRARVAPCQGEQLRRLPEHVGWKEYSGKQLYKGLESFFQLGSTFQGIQRLWHGESMQAVAEVALSEGEQHRAQQYNVHPALLDSIIQTGLGLLCVQELDFQGIPVKVGASAFCLSRPAPSRLFVACRGQSREDDFEVTVEAFDEHGGLVSLEFSRSVLLFGCVCVRSGRIPCHHSFSRRGTRRLAADLV